MEKSPFKYGATVSASAFTNREEEIEILYKNFIQGIHSTIISPRRWGKSSLIEKVVKNISKNEKKVKPLIIDLFSISGEEEFLEVFASEVLKASSSKWEDWVRLGKGFFQRLIPKISIGVDPNVDFSLSFDWEELKRHKSEILDLPEKIALKKGFRFVVCLDEFQNLAAYPNYEVFEKTLRASS